MTHPARDPDTIEITLSSGQIREITSLLTEVHDILRNLPDSTRPEISRAAEDWLQTTGNSYLLSAITDAIDSLTTQLTYHRHHAVNAAAAAAAAANRAPGGEAGDTSF